MVRSITVSIFATYLLIQSESLLWEDHVLSLALSKTEGGEVTHYQNLLLFI